MNATVSSVLVTGGAGYIGSHVVWALVDRGERVVVLDDLSTGSAGLLPSAATLVVGRAGDRVLVEHLIDEHRIGAVIHLAGSTLPSESLQRPLAYYRNNVEQSLGLVEACADRVPHLVFSSTAAVYGPVDGPVTEASPLDPATPYGETKLCVERQLRAADQAHALRSVVLRYFNVAGCDPAGRTGHPAASPHLISLACDVALGQREALDLFGDDYDTPDGTCIRDYIHVSDVAEAHVLALDHLRAGGASATLNCGYGHGASVKAVIAAVESLVGRALPVRQQARRAGDLGSVVAANEAIRRTLGWTARHDDLAAIVASTLEWKKRSAAQGPQAVREASS